MLDADEIDELKHDRKRAKNDRLADGDPDKITDDDLEEAED